MKVLTLDQRLERLGEEIAAAKSRALHRRDLGPADVGDILEELSREINEMDDDDHDAISRAERRLEDVQRKLDTEPDDREA